jgi:hypothetical protein
MERKTKFRSLAGHSILTALFVSSTVASIAGQQPSAQAAPATPSATDAAPTLEFVFEEVVTLDKAVNVGDTPLGHRGYIPITGGTVTGPKFNGKVLPGGWDWQLHLANGCGSLAANYMIQADDGTIVNVSNKGFFCAGSGGKSLWSPTFEAPIGPYGWLNSGVFVDVLSIAGSPEHPAVRIRFYQAK